MEKMSPAGILEIVFAYNNVTHSNWRDVTLGELSQIETVKM